MANHVIAVDPFVSRLVNELVDAGALVHWPESPQGWFGLRGAADHRIDVYVRSHWASLLLAPDQAEAAVASGRARVEREAASTWYVRVTEDDLSSPDGFAQALRFSRIALGLDERPAPGPRAAAEPPDAPPAPPPQDTVLARAAWEELARGAEVNLEPVGGKSWTWARLGMGPFPARLMLDQTGHQMHVDVVIGYATSTFKIEEVVNSIPVSPPVISYSLAPESLVSFRYSAPLGPADPRQAYLVLSTSVHDACMFSWSVYHDLTEATQELLGSAGFDPANGFPSPIQLLGTRAWRYEPWEAQPAPPPATHDP